VTIHNEIIIIIIIIILCQQFDETLDHIIAVCPFLTKEQNSEC